MGCSGSIRAFGACSLLVAIGCGSDAEPDPPEASSPPIEEVQLLSNIDVEAGVLLTNDEPDPGVWFSSDRRAVHRARAGQGEPGRAGRNTSTTQVDVHRLGALPYVRTNRGFAPLFVRGLR